MLNIHGDEVWWVKKKKTCLPLNTGCLKLSLPGGLPSSRCLWPLADTGVFHQFIMWRILTRRHPVCRAGALAGLDWCTCRPEERMFGQLLSNRKESALFWKWLCRGWSTLICFWSLDVRGMFCLKTSTPVPSQSFYLHGILQMVILV